ncbi:MAG: restriction endonuclease subunit S [Lactococcus raffinolactis]|jgi:type I restriction enzyme S subunit
MKEKVQAPELRFDGFTDDWELRKLTNITSSYSGLTYSPTDIQDTGTFVLRSSNVKNDQLIDADNVYVNPDIVNSINVKVGDVIIVVRNGSRALIGKHAIVNEEMPDTVIGAFMSAFRGENGNYINALLSTDNFQKEVHKSLGATINQITGKDFSMMIFPTPKFGEQQKIGAFFKQLDYTIALHQRKLDLLKEQKKGYLQKMFPKNGAKVPELRFAGFADDWEERKLSSGLREYTDRVIVEDDKEYYQISVRNNFGGITLRGSKMGNKIGRKRQAKINLTKYPQTLIFTRQTVEQGGIGWVDKYCDGAIVTENMPTISLDTSVFSKYFLTNLFQTRIFYKNAILDNIEGGSAQIAIHESKFLSSTLLFPNLDEQEKIGQFFKQLDDTIDLHQRKLDLLKEQKKGFLQKMFV